MQSIYALHQKSSDDIEKEEKFLLHSIDSIQDLYLIMLSSLIEIRKKEIVFLEASSKKHLATPEEKNPNRKFVNNAVLQLLEENNSLSIALEKRKINNWSMNDDYILILLNEIKQSSLYGNYMSIKKSSFEEDKEFVKDITIWNIRQDNLEKGFKEDLDILIEEAKESLGRDISVDLEVYGDSPVGDLMDYTIKIK
jgi:N utilization substance protein B